VCRKNLDHYTVELEKFLKWLREMMAKRLGGQQSASARPPDRALSPLPLRV